MSGASPGPLANPIAESQRGRMRRGVDLAALVGASAGSVVQLVELLRGASAGSVLALAITIALAACALVGLLGRASWTPVAYLALVMVANVVYLVAYGPWLGMGAVYVLAIALAFVFLEPRWWWRVVLVLAGTPLLVGLAFAIGGLDGSPALLLDDDRAWWRATLATATALAGIAVIVSYALGELATARHQLGGALAIEREQRQERARVEDELARARRARAIAELAAEVGAEVGAALAIVEERAAALARELRGEDASACLGDVIEVAGNAVTTMRTLTAFAPDAPVLAARGNAAAAARMLAKLVRRTLPSRISLEITADEETWVGIATTDLARICSNLVLNARDAIVATGKITVGVTREPAHVRIEVRDDGTGMDPHLLAQLFQPFFTTKPVGRGTGLCLAASKILIERAHGSIDVESHVGQGTRLVLRLPIVGEPPDPGTPR